MKAVKSFYLSPRFFIAIGIAVTLFIFSYFYTQLLFISQLIFISIIFLSIVDSIILFINNKAIYAYRQTPQRLSNGDDNEIQIFVTNHYAFKIVLIIIDELPFNFQIRDEQFKCEINPAATKVINYNLKPVKRGEYNFGYTNIFVSSPIGFVQRRFKFEGEKIIPVYPSYLQMRKYELLAISDRLTEAGIKKIRRIGHSQEFEQIKEYVRGDDYRTINWKATARKANLMVNSFEDEKSQQVYSVIDIGRVMKMPFDGMSLLDYAINSALVISNIALYKHDKAGLITFSNNVNKLLPAQRESKQMLKILDTLYKQKTDFLESDFEQLAAAIVGKINHRSLILLYTNFETLTALKRQLQYIRRIAASHLVVIIFFVNTSLQEIINKPANSVEEIYNKTIAEKFNFEKKQIVKELARYSVHSILTEPENLTVNTINKYLELKARGLI